MSSNFGDLKKNLIGGSLSIKGKTVIDSSRNLKCRTANIGELTVRDSITMQTNAHITGDLVVDGCITEKRECSNRFHGWWRKLSKSGYLYPNPPNLAPQMVYIDATDPKNITATFYGGDFVNVYQSIFRP